MNIYLRKIVVIIISVMLVIWCVSFMISVVLVIVVIEILIGVNGVLVELCIKVL